MNLFEVFEEVKCVVEVCIMEIGFLYILMLWFVEYVRCWCEIVGGEFWFYGIEVNCLIFEVFLMYVYE